MIINYQGYKFSGNNTQILLEQLEMQGFCIPYSCRSGICGSCKIILVCGIVKTIKKNQINLAGDSILSCSCIPVSNVTLV
ncbi:2Fe-2S iron-sulfur cluster-binding protein [Candidatus Pantoea carbekii]|uniref:Uncharacterized protein n=1 Tax=Candidatus Pantoea carbekii TaxID=1235990 RepID=U3U9S3_9GAMM|nr:2Fe-2S iron-sulfur cluster binding domain-containing protein [Candidatus Pantoea carbekii]AKC32156.1 iron-sulfur protein YcbX [Candidatus Pantoea carbekii]BAO00683.1 hypothetical protein YcbX [Candidatus Pantoea carbekii]